ncbi:MAG: sigma-54-dependent Fis family transcriptional regulator [Nitrospirota bacterium]|nr:MAG: sigma-54-dependent Fis family transcriptional regulator [Nitrospirota bacterium]
MELLNGYEFSKTRSVDNPSSRQSALDRSHLPQKDHLDLFAFDHLIGRSRVFKDLLDQVARVAGTDCRVLIIGEPGTGKELIAQLIHARSPRKHQPFWKIECIRNSLHFLNEEPGLPLLNPLLEYPGRQPVSFGMQENGTLFFEKIGALSNDNQAKMLRFLLNSELKEPAAPTSVNEGFRIIASTSRDLPWDATTKRFRADLLYRLNVIPLRIPPLRDRREDIPLFLHHFAKKHGMKHGKAIGKFGKNTLPRFLGYSWPGNIRELEMVVEQAVIALRGSTLDIPQSALGEMTPMSTLR